MSLRILFLDDDYERRRFARREAIGQRFVEVETAAQAIDALAKRGRFDVVCLDHDLDGELYAPSDHKSGFEVARWLARKCPEEKRPGVVVVHSHNTRKAKGMVRFLTVAGFSTIRIPFVAWKQVGAPWSGM